VIRRLLVLSVIVSLALPVMGGGPFTVRNSDFPNGVYDFHYYTFPNTAPVATAKRTIINGVDQQVTDPTMTNSGWEFGDPFTPAIGFWAATGPFAATQTSGALTMGWDFSAVTRPIKKVELKTRHILFLFEPWITAAVGDQIGGYVATPQTFGSGTFTQIYSYTGVDKVVSSETILDITSLLPAEWLQDPRLLELKFTYAQTPNPTIPGRHIEIFRDNTGTGIDGFLFRVTLVDCTVTPRAPGSAPSALTYDVTWSPTGSASYEVQEATKSDFSDAVTRTTTSTSSSFAHTVSTATTYYYRVRPVSCGDGPTSFGPTTQTVVLPQQPPASREFDVIVPLGSTTKVSQQIRFEGQPPGATFTATTDQPFLTASPQSGVVDGSGVVTITVAGDPKDLQVGANTGTVLLTVTTPTSSVAAHGTTTVSLPFTVSLVTPVAPTPRGQPSEDAVVIPAVAHLEGSGARFQSDIRLTNANTTEKTYLLSFTSAYSGEKATERQTSITLQPEQTVALNDVLRDFFGFAQASDSAGGSLEVRSTTGPMGSTFLTSRTYATTSIGTYGQFIPAVRLAKFLGLGGGALTLTQVTQNAAFRSNIGIVEGLGLNVAGRLRIFSKTGQNVKDVPFSLRPFEFLQLGGFLAAQGVPMDDARIEIVVDSGSGKVTGYASVLDNTTQDPLLSSPVQTSELSSNRYVLPGMADLESPSTNFHSDVRVFNPSTSSVVATLTYYPQGNPSASTARDATLGPGEIKAYDNILPSLFGLTGTGGSIVVTTSDNRALVISGRTYSNAPAGGTYGQFIPAVTPADGIGVGDAPLQLLQLEQSPNFRSNVGLNELTGSQVTVEVTVVFADSKVTASTSLTLQGNEFRQLGSLIGMLSPGKNAYNARVFVRVTGGTGRITAYASVIDGRSLDPTYVPAQK